MIAQISVGQELRDVADELGRVVRAVHHMKHPVVLGVLIGVVGGAAFLFAGVAGAPETCTDVGSVGEWCVCCVCCGGDGRVLPASFLPESVVGGPGCANRFGCGSSGCTFSSLRSSVSCASISVDCHSDAHRRVARRYWCGGCRSFRDQHRLRSNTVTARLKQGGGNARFSITCPTRLVEAEHAPKPTKGRL